MGQNTVSFGLGGGMDLVTPAIAMPPGRVIAALNYEPVAGGYKRLAGYERYDGRTVATEITRYWIIGFANASAPLDNVQVLIPFREAEVAEQMILSGDLQSGTATGYYVVYQPPGNTEPSPLHFSVGKTIQNGGGTITSA